MDSHAHCGRPGRGKGPGRSSYHIHDPELLFAALNLVPGQSFLDLGCGPGDYALRAAREVGARGSVLAVDRFEELASHVEGRARAGGLGNVRTLCADITKELPLDAASFDCCFLCTVLHSMGPESRARVLGEARRLLAPAGRLAVVELKKEDTGFGPPLAQRLSEAGLERLAAGAGFRLRLSVSLGPSHLGVFAPGAGG